MPTKRTTGTDDAAEQDGWTLVSRIADELVRVLRPASVLCAGGASEQLAVTLRARGVDACAIPMPTLASGAPGGPYDVVTCIDALECLPAEDRPHAIAQLSGAAETILVSLSAEDGEDPLPSLRAFAGQGMLPDASVDAAFAAFRTIVLRRSAVPRVEDIIQSTAQRLALAAELKALRVSFARLADEHHALRERTRAVLDEVTADTDRSIDAIERAISATQTSLFWRLKLRLRRPR